MKLISMLAALLILVTGHTQSANLNTTYVLTQNVSLNECDAVGVSTGNTHIAFRGFEFSIDRILTNDVVIHFVRWKSDATKNSQYFNRLSSSTQTPDVYFLLPLNQFQMAMEKIRRAPLALGLAIIPIKMRFGNKGDAKSVDTRYFTFESAVSLGFSVGLNIKLDRSKFTKRNNLALLTGISLSSVPLDSATTKGYMKSSTNSASITWHLGVVYQIDNFQIGLFSGIDYLAGEVGRQWKYRNKPWLGIGLGYSIFQAKKTTDTQ